MLRTKRLLPISLHFTLRALSLCYTWYHLWTIQHLSGKPEPSLRVESLAHLSEVQRLTLYKFTALIGVDSSTRSWTKTLKCLMHALRLLCADWTIPWPCSVGYANVLYLVSEEEPTVRPLIISIKNFWEERRGEPPPLIKKRKWPRVPPCSGRSLKKLTWPLSNSVVEPESGNSRAMHP